MALLKRFGCLVALVVMASAVAVSVPMSFYQDFFITWSPSNVQILNGGQELHLTLDSNAGSGFASKNSFLFGNIDMEIKLVPGNSAGTVTAYYLTSMGANHDELDFEFLGNTSGEPYIVQTNVFANGVGGKEERVYLWFDPSANFHTYSVSWNNERIIFLIDGTPIRVHYNNEALGLKYPNRQPMQVFSSLWNGDDWATRGGLVKIDWSNAPFVAAYRNFKANACVVPKGGSASSCIANGSKSFNTPIVDSQELNARLKWVKQNFLIYDYCIDRARYPSTPIECTKRKM